MKQPEPKESEIQTAVCEYLALRNYFFWRNNNTGIYRPSANGGFWTTNKYSMKGIPDIIVIDDTGHAIFLEIKRPSGRQSPDQKEFQRRCEEKSAEYHVIKKIEDLIEIGL